MCPNCQDQCASHHQQCTEIAHQQSWYSCIRITCSIHYTKQDSTDCIDNCRIECKTHMSDENTRNSVTEKDRQPFDNVLECSQTTQKRQSFIFTLDIIYDYTSEDITIKRIIFNKTDHLQRDAMADQHQTSHDYEPKRSCSE